MFRVGIYGWRKRFLYTFILILAIGIVLNLSLTFWIMSVLDFSPDGIGTLKIEDDGIRVEGRAQFDRPVHFSQLSTLDVSFNYKYLCRSLKTKISIIEWILANILSNLLQ